MAFQQEINRMSKAIRLESYLANLGENIKEKAVLMVLINKKALKLNEGFCFIQLLGHEPCVIAPKHQWPCKERAK